MSNHDGCSPPNMRMPGCFDDYKLSSPASSPVLSPAKGIPTKTKRRPTRSKQWRHVGWRFTSGGFLAKHRSPVNRLPTVKTDPAITESKSAFSNESTLAHEGSSITQEEESVEATLARTEARQQEVVSAITPTLHIRPHAIIRVTISLPIWRELRNGGIKVNTSGNRGTIVTEGIAALRGLLPAATFPSRRQTNQDLRKEVTEQHDKLAEITRISRLKAHLSETDLKSLYTSLSAFPGTDAVYILEHCSEPFEDLECCETAVHEYCSSVPCSKDYVEDYSLSRTLLLREDIFTASVTPKALCNCLFACFKGLPRAYKSKLLQFRAFSVATVTQLAHAGSLSYAFEKILETRNCAVTKLNYKLALTTNLFRCPSDAANWLYIELLRGLKASTSAHISSVLRVHSMLYFDRKIEQLTEKRNLWLSLKKLPGEADKKQARELETELSFLLADVHQHCGFQAVLRHGIGGIKKVLREAQGRLRAIPGNPEKGSHDTNSRLLTVDGAQVPQAACLITSGVQQSTYPPRKVDKGLPESRPLSVASKPGHTNRNSYETPSPLPKQSTPNSRPTASHLLQVATNEGQTLPNQKASVPPSIRLPVPIRLAITAPIYIDLSDIMQDTEISHSTFHQIADLAGRYPRLDLVRFLPNQERYNKEHGVNVFFWYEFSSVWFQQEARGGTCLSPLRAIETYNANPPSDAANLEGLGLPAIMQTLRPSAFDSPITMAMRAKIMLKHAFRIKKLLSKETLESLSENCVTARKLSLSIFLQFGLRDQVPVEQLLFVPSPMYIATDKHLLHTWYASRLSCSLDSSGAARFQQSRQDYIRYISKGGHAFALFPDMAPLLPETLLERTSIAEWINGLTNRYPNLDYVLYLLKHLRSSELDMVQWLFQELLLGKTGFDSVHIANVLGANAGQVARQVSSLEQSLTAWAPDRINDSKRKAVADAMWTV
ncbi:hypothetical protein BJ508DRAFT_328170 [Ascobolus immersus RN42]|uniref:Uncharacterized protein n=1 Tax=Ascobolus immersus RN42 TaxID=1160509 RepID=A0A3N4ICZ8_ASCIM|nr:hypothetical protein BJ508DRAFT_328170 [Ascobolus immersus RN42]